jgi:F-type H+-transporting ATPase subunit b
MPQLDQFTYLTQFVWLCVFYMSFYLLLMNDGLPKVSRILKLRAQLVSQHTSSSDDVVPHEIEQDAVIKQSLSSSVSYLDSCISGASEWCNNIVSTLNDNQLKTMNSAYLSSLGEISVSQVLKQSALETISPLTRNTTVLKTLVTQPEPLAVKLSSIYLLRTQKSLLSPSTVTPFPTGPHKEGGNLRGEGGPGDKNGPRRKKN